MSLQAVKTNTGGFDTTRSEQSAIYDGSNDYSSASNTGADTVEFTLTASIRILDGSGNHGIISIGDGGSGGTNNAGMYISGNKLVAYNGGTGAFSTRVLRDSEWYQVTCSFKLDETGNEKCHMYVNDERIESWSSGSPSGLGTALNNVSNIFVGRIFDLSFFNGKIAGATYLEGVSFQGGGVSISAIMETFTAGNNGSLPAVKPDATLVALADAAGTQSFCQTNLIGDGADASTHNNDLTPNGSMSHTNNGSDDTPSNPHAILNPLTQGAANIQEGGTEYTTAAGASKFGSIGLTTGKWYWELHPSSTNYQAGLTRSDIRMVSGAADTVALVGNTTLVNGANCTVDSDTFAHTGTETIGFALDCDALTLDVYVDGTLQVEFSTFTIAGPYFPAFDRNASGTVTHGVAFEESDWLQTPPTGHKAIREANLDAPQYQGIDHQNNLLYTGNAPTGQSITGNGWQPDIVWPKQYNAAQLHYLFDVVRGVGNQLFPDDPSQEVSVAASLESFDADGFTLGTSGSSPNDTPDSYVAWNFKAGGAAVENTDGSITSQVSVAEPGHLSIISTEGTGAAGTIGHGLPGAPEAVVAKNRTDSTSWPMWHIGLTGGTYSMDFNNATGEVNNSAKFAAAPTATVISVGDNNETNGGIGDDMIYYALRSVPGLCKIGTYKSNNSADGPFVDVGFEIGWLVLRLLGASNWAVFDLGRNNDNPFTKALYIDSTTGEVTFASGGLDITAKGFKHLQTSAQMNNTSSGSTHMFIAIAKSAGGGPNLPPLLGR